MAASDLTDVGPPRSANCDILTDTIRTESSFIVRESKHDIEKPYDIRYKVQADFPQTNISRETHPVLIRNFRPHQTTESFDTYGFCSRRIGTPISAVDFKNDESVEHIFYPAAKKVLELQFPDAHDVKILEHGYRERHVKFPTFNKEDFEFAQPAVMAHIDFSLQSATRMARAAFQKTPEHYSRLLTVNLWKSLQGPGNDWPLALCDWRTTDLNSESVTADIVYHNRFVENTLVYHNPKNEWYYFKDLAEDEIIIFRQTDTDFESSNGGGVPHVSIYNPMADENAACRASIELRAYLFFK